MDVWEIYFRELYVKTSHLKLPSIRILTREKHKNNRRQYTADNFQNQNIQYNYTCTRFNRGTDDKKQKH